LHRLLQRDRLVTVLKIVLVEGNHKFHCGTITYTPLTHYNCPHSSNQKGAETELIIDRNLRRRGCSCIVVAHRLSTIRDCDEILVLQRGKVVERGTHDDLRDRAGAYVRLISSEEA
jgi:hypothetical protein